MASLSDITRLVAAQLTAIKDDDTRRILSTLVVPPQLQLRDLPLGAPGARYRTWLVAKSPYHPIGLAYAESGYDSATPWGYVSVNHLSLGDPAQWWPALEDAYWASEIQRGGPKGEDHMGMERHPTALLDLVRIYLHHAIAPTPETHWAWEEVTDRVQGPDLAASWELVDALVAAADADSLGYIGAGPLEDFVHKFGAKEWPAIEQRALRDPKFRECLGRIWISEGDLPPEPLARIVRASGNRIQPLPPRPR